MANEVDQNFQPKNKSRILSGQSYYLVQKLKNVSCEYDCGQSSIGRVGVGVRVKNLKCCFGHILIIFSVS